MSHDYITVVQAAEPCNKRVTIDAKGNLHKERASFGSGGAAVVKVENLKHLAQIAAELAKRADQFWILGYPPQLINEDSFRIVTLKQAEAIRGTSDRPTEPFKDKEGNWCVTRTKELFQQSSVVLFDYDPTDDMPPELRSLEPQEWLERMNDVIPRFREAGYLVTPSTSSRILRDETPAFEDRGFHVYMMVEDANDVERLRQDIVIAALDTPHGYLRKWGEHKRGATICDPAVFSPERQDFCGAPDVGEGLELAPFAYELIEGPRLDTTALSIADATVVRVQSLTGYKIRQGKAESSRRLAHYFEESNLNLDQELVTECGTVTIRAFWLSDDTKVRVQAFTRPESESFAAFIAKNKAGVPFYFDLGANLKLMPSKDDVRATQFALAMSRVQSLPVEKVEAEWVTWTDGISKTQADKVRRAVATRTGLGLQPLQGELSDYRTEQRGKKREKANSHREIYDASVGKQSFRDYRDADLDRILPQLRVCLTNNHGTEQLFNYANTIVSVRIDPPKTAQQRFLQKKLGDEYPNRPKIFAHTTGTLRPRILEVATFWAPRTENKQPEVLPVPHAVLTGILDDGRTGEPLAGLCESPMILPDGSVITTQGYDSLTAHYFMYPPRLNQSIPDGVVSKEDVQQAIEFLRSEVLEDFPFKSDLDRDAAIALMLTALRRRFMKAAPGCLVTATTQASGKSTLVSLVFHIAFGRGAAACGYTEDADEMRKLLTAVLLEGNSGLNFDNIHHGSRLDSDELAKIITEGVIKARVLGKSESPEMPAAVLICATGNNVELIGDMVSRMFPIRLEPKSEFPDKDEKGRGDIEAWLEANRHKCLSACFAILMHYHQQRDAGNEVALTAPSRFPEWDEMVRRPMVLAGLADPAELFEVNRNADPVAQERVKFLRAWHDRFGSNWITLREVVDAVEDAQPPHPGFPARYAPDQTKAEKDFYTATHELLNGLKDLSPRRLGSNLRYFEGRWYQVSDDESDALWRLVKYEETSKRVPTRWRVEQEIPQTTAEQGGGCESEVGVVNGASAGINIPQPECDNPQESDRNATQCNGVQEGASQWPF